MDSGYIVPKVSIGYSYDSKEHKDRVLNLADRLRNDGIDCLIDQPLFLDSFRSDELAH